MRNRINRIMALLISVVMISTSFVFAEIQENTVNYEGFMSSQEQEMAIYYDDSYWTGSSAKYNNHLASLSMAFALTGYDKTARNASRALACIGCSKIQSKEYKSNTENCVAAVMGKKKLSDGTILIPVIVRSQKTDKIWIKNIEAGSKGEAAGYKAAASKVYSYVTSYVKGTKAKKYKVWIMGHSRYGAIANLTAKKLNSKYGKSKVYAYCFENPMTAVKSSKNAKMTNIHNVRVLDSGVTKVLPSYMKFDKYGKWDRTFAVKDGNEAEMLKMLAKINTDASTYQSPTNCKRASLNLSRDKFADEGKTVSQEEVWDQLLMRIKVLAASRKAYSITKSAKSVAAANELGYKKSDVYTIEKALQTAVRLVIDLKGDNTKLQALGEEVLANMTEGINMSNLNGITPDSIEFISRPIGKLLFGPVFSGRLSPEAVIGTSKEEYSKYVNDFWNSTGLEKSKLITKSQKKQLKLIMATMTEPLLKVMAKDFDGDKEGQVLITALYNLDSLIQAHYPEVTMAWLMTEDSNYTGN